jgi:hypothetical protein
MTGAQVKRDVPRVLVCDGCGCATRKPAIDVALVVLCVRCAPRGGMFPGEHGTAHTYDEWKILAADHQAWWEL